MRTITHITLSIIILSCVGFGFIALSKQTQAMGLKENVTLTGDVITLGDLFYDLPRDKGKVLGPAPRPGSDMVLNARTLMRIALALDLPWRPNSSNDYIVLRRAATVIDKEMIERDLHEALKDHGYNGDYDLVFPNETSEIILPMDQPATFEITDFQIDKKRDWFDATIMAPSADNPIRNTRISGRVFRLVNVPVLKDAMRNGSIIRDGDIEFTKMREYEVGHNIVLDYNTLKGMTPRRIVFGGKPIQASEITAPQIVSRGETVTMILKNGSMNLTAMGRSLENGAKGDIVRVVNTGSSRTIQGIVTGEQEITIESF